MTAVLDNPNRLARQLWQGAREEWMRQEHPGYLRPPAWDDLSTPVQQAAVYAVSAAFAFGVAHQEPRKP